MSVLTVSLGGRMLMEPVVERTPAREQIVAGEPFEMTAQMQVEATIPAMIPTSNPSAARSKSARSAASEAGHG